MDVLGKWPLSELVPIVRDAKDRQERVVFVGSGVEELKKPESRKVLSEMIAPGVAYWTVRSERDKSRLIRYGIPGERISVAADLAWTLEPVAADFGRTLLTELGVDISDHLVGVNLTSEQFVVEQEPELFHKLAQFLDAQIESKNSCILFFANEVREEDSYDKAAATKTVALMRHKQRAVIVPNEYRTPQQALSLIDCCDFVVSMRYHFCLFAALQNVPFIGLLRSDKVADLCADLDWPYKASLPALDPKTLLALANQLEEEGEALQLRLQVQSTEMRRRALTNRLALAALSG